MQINFLFSEFPAFQNFLYEAKMCPIILQMAKNDQEAYVRASALKCLSKMVMINVIWENDLNNNDLLVWSPKLMEKFKYFNFWFSAGTFIHRFVQ